jgi:hypothetical protein
MIESMEREDVMPVEANLPPLREDAPLPKEYWPNLDQIVTEDDTPVDSVYAEKQQRLLTESLYASWNPGESFVAMANVGLFYQLYEPPLVPDVLYSRGITTPADPFPKENRSYFVWMRGKPPDVVIEHVSNREGGEDTRKLTLYANVPVPYYVIWDPERHLSEQPLRLLALNGGAYAPFPGAIFDRLGLGLVVWHGVYEDLEADWLRWCDRNGNLIPTGAERAVAERERADAERERADRLAAKLRALGVDPNGGES